jgi:hypothetical protein
MGEIGLRFTNLRNLYNQMACLELEKMDRCSLLSAAERASLQAV